MPFLEKLKILYPADRFSTHADHLAVASRDESSLSPVLPQAIVWAMSAEEISRTIRLCRKHKVPVTTHGAGSALEGSTIPSGMGLVLDLRRMTRVLNLWPEDLQVEV